MSQVVFAGLSGGVDSATSAALLKDRGYTVVGAFIKIWSPEFLECTWKEDRLDAMRVCAALDIPFREIDLSDEYKKEVIGDMIAEYAKGITPNPDVLCNRSIKFGHFANWAFAQGADLIATGHYAQIEKNEHGAFALQRGKDSGKDQSYFLYRLDQNDLARALFPVGGFEKKEVRALAQKFDLPVSAKPDSQGLCFVGDVSLKDFLSRFITLLPGAVLDEKGEVIGTHEGAALCTVGQRHGFTVGGSTPHYVVAIDIANNIVRVSTRREDAARISTTLSDLHWIAAAPALPFGARAQARYREEPFDTTVEERAGTIVAHFEEPRIAAPGQSLVFYDGQTCLGGGVINR